MEAMDEVVDDNHWYQPFKDIFFHHCNQQLIPIVPAEALDIGKSHALVMQKIYMLMVRSLRFFSYL